MVLCNSIWLIELIQINENIQLNVIVIIIIEILLKNVTTLFIT